MNLRNPPTKPGKMWRNYQQKRAILSRQNDDLLHEVGLLCLRKQESFELQGL